MDTITSDNTVLPPTWGQASEVERAAFTETLVQRHGKDTVDAAIANFGTSVASAGQPRGNATPQFASGAGGTGH